MPGDLLTGIALFAAALLLTVFGVVLGVRDTLDRAQQMNLEDSNDGNH